jgi:hypothetical protein
MKDLIEALTIFAKYTTEDVINCSHDELAVCVDPKTVNIEDKARLKELSFRVNADGYFYSFRFGSC